MTHEVNNRDDALGLISRRGLDQMTFSAEQHFKLGLRVNFIDFDRLGRALEFDSVGLAFLLQSSKWS